ncbi:type IX secretion system protein PorQ [Hymenobacter ginsengisoli]|uniref:Type IX secretion system protein PorQ n=1 Tax=Hymenobacter ginsengisoli TaxID=1051626 RepID=A0ABP8PZ42_9BACT|nr:MULTISPECIES: type IX secretion system protein PorQ [unclassified Hymenobacter]MBO2030536.1 type IX secretion system protein PorQ [Hymenobacter sp. BT559]
MKYLAACLLLLPLAARAQIGGRAAFPFLALPPSAQVAALGGLTASARSSDPTQFFASPALLNADMDHAAALSYVSYVSDIKQSTAAYAFNTEKRGRFGLGLTYLNYGSLESYDAAGNALGTFSVNEYALAAADSYTKGKFTVGLTAKLAVSGIAGNRAVGLASDAGVLFKPHADQDFTVGLVVKNAGYMLKPYTAAAREPLPLDVQLGTTIKPEHMPLRFTFTAHHLHQWNIQYLDPNARGTLDANNVEVKPSFNWGDNLARHFTAAAELLLGKGLSLRMGYNHLQGRELRLDNVGGGAGFSFGAMIKISQFQLDYTYATLQAAGSSNYFTLSRSLGSFLKKE